ncbi:uncharacterized protein ASCRUDRAFT_20007, partial [Ascoidea rubescens DSM 1968]
KIIFVSFLFLVSLITFVSQTELVSYSYNSLNFNQPFLLLYLTHCAWIIFWFLQTILISTYKKFVNNPNNDSLKSFILNEINLAYQISNLIYNYNGNEENTTNNSNVNDNDNDNDNDDFGGNNYMNIKIATKTSSILSNLVVFFKSTPILYMSFYSFILSIILNIAASTWYISMNLTTSNNVTAIYNSSPFFAYIFAIFLLKNEFFSILKVSSVLMAIFGIFIVIYSTNDNKDSDTTSTYANKPHQLIGNLLILFGSILYGYYDVFYKKYLCPTSDNYNSLNSMKKANFSNFIMTLIGFASFIILTLFVLVVKIFFYNSHLSSILLNLSIISSKEWLFISLSVSSNLIFCSASLILMSITSPVLTAVSSILTIIFVGIIEWIFFKIGLSFGQILGDIVVLLGFIGLTITYWNDISSD